MIIEKVKKTNWLNIARILWGVVGILCIIPAGVAFVFFWAFSEAASPNDNANYLFIFDVISFPIVCIGSSIGIWFLKNKHKKLAFYVFLLPVIPLILIYVGSYWMSESYPTMRKQGNATSVAKCTLPILDGGDGFDTTGCGMLEDGIPVTGITNSTSEAHNWQFSYQFTPPYKTGGITIYIEFNGKSCPQIRFLDSSGGVIEGRAFLSALDECPKNGSKLEFNPPGEGTYILRLTTPEIPGAYWLRIYKH